MQNKKVEQKEEQVTSLKSSPITTTLIVLGTVFVLYHIIGAGITFLSIGNLTKENVQGFRLMTMLSQFLFIFVPTLLFAIWQEDSFSKIFSIKIPSLPEVLITILATLSLQSVAQIFLYVQDLLFPLDKFLPALDSMRKTIEQIYEILISAESVSEFIYVVLVVALTPAICEEPLFRGLVQYNLSKASNPKIGFILTGVIFALYHLNAFSFVPLMAIGIFFGYIVYKSGSIYLSIIAHFVNNFSATYFHYAFGKRQITPDQPLTPLIMFLLSIAIFVASIYIFEFLSKNRKQIEM